MLVEYFNFQRNVFLYVCFSSSNEVADCLIFCFHSQPFWNILIIALSILKWCCGCVFFGCFPLYVSLGPLKICIAFQRLAVFMSALEKKENLFSEASNILPCAKTILQ
jgi:hypothetical protein